MHRVTKIAGIFALALGTAACGDEFLTGPGKTENPNSPITATAAQLLIGVQAGQFTRHEGQLARQAGIYTQQLAGINNQQKSWGSLYLVTEGDISGYFSGIYINGGLTDLRKIQTLAKESKDAQLEGIAKIWEAYVIGMSSSIWGDLPYREAIAGVKAPKLDPQEQVYADVQKLLDEGIQLMAGAGPGPASADVVYGGNVGRWVRLAHTLKARFHMHTGERLGNAAYQAAIAAAEKGINEAPTSVDQAVHGQAAGDFRATHGTALETANIWAQFLGARQDIVAGNALLKVLEGRPGDPRLAGYFDPVGTPPAFRGGDQLGNTVGAASEVNRAVRRAFAFRQPFATWTENELILAEAKFRTGNAAAALTHVNNVRGKLGLAALPAPITLEKIAEEKYIAMFQDIEAWNDYKRNCFPKLSPGGQPVAKEVPGRLPYGLAERNNNPNIPLPSNQVARNWNDPNPCS